jgi:hypothetical protein
MIRGNERKCKEVNLNGRRYEKRKTKNVRRLRTYGSGFLERDRDCLSKNGRRKTENVKGGMVQAF